MYDRPWLQCQHTHTHTDAHKHMHTNAQRGKEKERERWMPRCTVWCREASHCCSLAPILSPVVFVTVAFLSVDCGECVCSAEFINTTGLYALYLGILSSAASHTCKHWLPSLVFIIINVDRFYCSCHFQSCMFRSNVFARTKRTIGLQLDVKIQMIVTSRRMSNLSSAFDPSSPRGGSGHQRCHASQP